MNLQCVALQITADCGIIIDISTNQLRSEHAQQLLIAILMKHY